MSRSGARFSQAARSYVLDLTHWFTSATLALSWREQMVLPGLTFLRVKRVNMESIGNIG